MAATKMLSCHVVSYADRGRHAMPKQKSNNLLLQKVPEAQRGQQQAVLLCRRITCFLLLFVFPQRNIFSAALGCALTQHISNTQPTRTRIQQHYIGHRNCTLAIPCFPSAKRPCGNTADRSALSLFPTRIVCRSQLTGSRNTQHVAIVGLLDAIFDHQASHSDS